MATPANQRVALGSAAASPNSRAAAGRLANPVTDATLIGQGPQSLQALQTTNDEGAITPGRLPNGEERLDVNTIGCDDLCMGVAAPTSKAAASARPSSTQAAPSYDDESLAATGVKKEALKYTHKVRIVAYALLSVYLNTMCQTWRTPSAMDAVMYVAVQVLATAGADVAPGALPIFTCVQFLGAVPAIGAVVTVLSHREKLSFIAGTDSSTTYFIVRALGGPISINLTRGLVEMCNLIRARALQESTDLSTIFFDVGTVIFQREPITFVIEKVRVTASKDDNNKGSATYWLTLKLPTDAGFELPRLYQGVMSCPITASHVPQQNTPGSARTSPVPADKLIGNRVELANFAVLCQASTYAKSGRELMLKTWARMSLPSWPDNNVAGGSVRRDRE
jgi:hypothetical protein